MEYKFLSFKRDRIKFQFGFRWENVMWNVEASSFEFILKLFSI